MRQIRVKHGERGAAAVEFALVLPLLLLLVFGTIEFGIMIFDKSVITNASREGAREGILFRNDRSALLTNIDNRVNGYIGDHLITFGAPSTATVTTDPVDPSTVTTGTPLTVTVHYQYDFLLIPAFVVELTDGIALEAATTMRTE